MGGKGHQFTDEERKLAAQKRNEKMTPYERSHRASLAAHARWYRVDAADETRVNRALRWLAGVVGHGMHHGDYELAMKALSIMVPYEKMKIALNRGLISSTATPATPEQLENQDALEQRLLETQKRRQAKMMPTIEEAQIVKPTT
jgi:hypothetical protein